MVVEESTVWLCKLNSWSCKRAVSFRLLFVDFESIKRVLKTRPLLKVLCIFCFFIFLLHELPRAEDARDLLGPWSWDLGSHYTRVDDICVCYYIPLCDSRLAMCDISWVYMCACYTLVDRTYKCACYTLVDRTALFKIRIALFEIRHAMRSHWPVFMTLKKQLVDTQRCPSRRV